VIGRSATAPTTTSPNSLRPDAPAFTPPAKPPHPFHAFRPGNLAQPPLPPNCEADLSFLNSSSPWDSAALSAHPLLNQPMYPHAAALNLIPRGASLNPAGVGGCSGPNSPYSAAQCYNNLGLTSNSYVNTSILSGSGYAVGQLPRNLANPTGFGGTSITDNKSRGESSGNTGGLGGLVRPASGRLGHDTGHPRHFIHSVPSDAVARDFQNAPVAPPSSFNSGGTRFATPGAASYGNWPQQPANVRPGCHMGKGHLNPDSRPASQTSAANMSGCVGTGAQDSPPEHNRMTIEMANAEQTYNVQQTAMQLAQTGSSKHEIRKALQTFLAQERVVEAHMLLNLLQQMGLPVDVVMYNLVMTGYKKKRLWQPVFQVLQQMQESGHAPDAVSFNILIDACGKAQELERAFEFYREMRNLGIQASVNTFTSLIDACGKSNKLPQACELLDQMQRENVHPNAHTFTTIINACTQAHDFERGVQVLYRMIECGAHHESGHTSATPYTTLIRACGKALEVDKAFRVLQCMLDVGVRPNVVTFNCLIDACSNAKQLDKALKAFKLMQQCHSTPDIITYNAVIDACCKASEIDTAMELLRQMRMQNIRPNMPIFTTMLEACVRGGRIEQSFELLHLMRMTNAKPSISILNALIEVCGNAKRIQEAIEIFGFMRQANIKPNSASCTTLIDACAKAKDIHKAMAVLNEFLHSGERLDCAVFNAVMKICGEMGNIQYATQVFEYMLQSLTAPNSFTYSSFIEACINGNDARRALQIVHEMGSGGWAVSQSHLEAIVLMCARNNEPFQVLRSSMPQIESGKTPICSAEVYDRVCLAISQAETSPGEADAIIMDTISNLHRDSPTAEVGGHDTRQQQIHLLQIYLNIRQKQLASRVTRN